MYIFLVTNHFNGNKYIIKTEIRNISKKKLKIHIIGRNLYNTFVKYDEKYFQFDLISVCFDQDINQMFEYCTNRYKPKSSNFNIPVSLKKNKGVHTRKTIGQYTSKGELVTINESMKGAGKELCINYCSISKACISKKSYKGFIWKVI